MKRSFRRLGTILTLSLLLCPLLFGCDLSGSEPASAEETAEETARQTAEETTGETTGRETSGSQTTEEPTEETTERFVDDAITCTDGSETVSEPQATEESTEEVTVPDVSVTLGAFRIRSVPGGISIAFSAKDKYVLLPADRRGTIMRINTDGSERTLTLTDSLLKLTYSLNESGNLQISFTVTDPLAEMTGWYNSATGKIVGADRTLTEDLALYACIAIP